MRRTQAPSRNTVAFVSAQPNGKRMPLKLTLPHCIKNVRDSLAEVPNAPQ